MGRRGGLRAAKAAVALGAVTLLWFPLPARASAIRVTVNGQRIQLDSADATIQDAVDAMGLQLRVGFMRAIATGDPVPHRVRQPRVWLDERPVALTKRVGNGDHIRVENGVDFVEPVVEELQNVPTTGYPDIETQLWQPGKEGVVKRLVGRFSGQVAQDVVVVETPVPAAPLDGPAVLLSFDDGPDGRWTPQVLDILRDKGLKAMFCVVGVQIDRHPELVQRIHAEGHTLCNHTQHHDMRLPLRSQLFATAELEAVQNKIRELTGTTPRFYRGPGGSMSPFIVSEAHRLGMRVLAWNVDPGDYRKPGAEHIQDRIAVNIRNGGVALMHDGGGDRSQTVAQLPGLIDRLRAQGYSFVLP